MRYAVKIYEQIYGGMHEIQVKEVIEADCLEDVKIYCQETSIELQQDYNILEEMGVYDQAREDTDNEDDYEQYLDDFLNENAAYEIYPIINSEDKTSEQLSIEFYYDPEYFMVKYCGPQII